MSSHSYWDRMLLTRRKALRAMAAATGGVVALSLVGCGGSDDGANGRGENAGGEYLDPTTGKRGGTLTFMLASSWTVLNPVTTTGATTSRFASMVHSSLLGPKLGVAGVGTADLSLEPDLALAMPEQPDPLTYVFKLRDAKFHDGKPVTSADVKYSYDTYGKSDKSSYKAQYDWYDRTETPDAKTVVIKAKYPYADIMQAFVGWRDAFILSQEFNEGPDASNKLMGSGPYIFVNHEAPLSATFRRNPDYYFQPMPYFDQVKAFLGSDTAKRLADSIAGQYNVTWWFGVEERDQLKAARPSMTYEGLLQNGDRISFKTDRPPFNDERVRQALSMSINRDKLSQATAGGEGDNDTQFQVVNTHWGARSPKDIPGAAKFWEYNIAEAKKLLAAAGITSPIKADFTHADSTGSTGQPIVDRGTLTLADWKANGIADLTDISQTPNAFTNASSRGNFEGMILHPGGAASPYLGTTLSNTYLNGTRKGISNITNYNNPRVNELLEKQRGQLNMEERKSTFREIEELLAKDQPQVHYNRHPATFFWDNSLVNVRMPHVFGVMSFVKKWWYR